MAVNFAISVERGAVMTEYIKYKIVFGALFCTELCECLFVRMWVMCCYLHGLYEWTCSFPSVVQWYLDIMNTDITDIAYNEGIFVSDATSLWRVSTVPGGAGYMCENTVTLWKMWIPCRLRTPQGPKTLPFFLYNGLSLTHCLAKFIKHLFKDLC